MDQIKYPQFKQIYFKLSAEGLPFAKIDKSQLVPIGESHGINEKRISSLGLNENNNNHSQEVVDVKVEEEVEEEEEEANKEPEEEEKDKKGSSPWSGRGLEFGVWYKKKIERRS